MKEVDAATIDFKDWPPGAASLGGFSFEAKMQLCGCGCGLPAPIAKRTSTREGYKKGDVKPFRHGHHVKGNRNPRWNGGVYMGTTGYVYHRAPGHPNVDARGYVREHVLVAERALGKILPVSAVVHHVNGERSDNRPANLVVCQDNSYHMLLHARQKALEACGDPTWRKCYGCGEWAPTNQMRKRNQWDCWIHAGCRA